MRGENKTDCLPQAERRSFFGAIIGLVVSGITATLGVTIGRYSIAPAFSGSKTERWIDLGSIEEIPEGKLVKRGLMISQSAGWGEFMTKRSVWIVRKRDEFKVFSAVCPHLGCTVNNSGESFVCACHGSTWDMTGNKLAGPTPRNLDSLEHRVENNLLKIKYQNFKQGITAKEVAGEDRL